MFQVDKKSDDDDDDDDDELLPWTESGFLVGICFQDSGSAPRSDR